MLMPISSAIFLASGDAFTRPLLADGADTAGAAATTGAATGAATVAGAAAATGAGAAAAAGAGAASDAIKAATSSPSFPRMANI